jgi:hypothetical protein
MTVVGRNQAGVGDWLSVPMAITARVIRFTGLADAGVPTNHL